MPHVDRLAGKVALITGAARGMGASHARAVVENGGKVVIGDLLDEAGEALAAELGADNATYVHLDVTNEDNWTSAVAAAVAKFGKLNVLINNAGITNYGDLGEYQRKTWDLTLAINATGPFLGVTAALDSLKAAAPSSIINVSSASGLQGEAGLHGYTASKWALRGFTKSAALELGPSNIRVNSVHPGFIRTPMTAQYDSSQAPGPLRRVGEPEEVSALIVYLASDESSFSTGSEFIVDGGVVAGPFVPAPTS